MVELAYLSLKKTTFFSYFRHISLCFYSNFDRESSLDAEFDSASNDYPHRILLMDPATPKTRNIPKKMWWWHHHHVFLGISYFWGSGVLQKYAMWVLIGCGIKFRIQRSLLIEIWVKTELDMSKIRTKKVVFFNDKYANSTIMVDLFYWNSIGSWIPTHKNLFWHVFL